MSAVKILIDEKLLIKIVISIFLTFIFGKKGKFTTNLHSRHMYKCNRQYCFVFYSINLRKDINKTFLLNIKLYVNYKVYNTLITYGKCLNIFDTNFVLLITCI